MGVGGRSNERKGMRVGKRTYKRQIGAESYVGSRGEKEVNLDKCVMEKEPASCAPALNAKSYNKRNCTKMRGV